MTADATVRAARGHYPGALRGGADHGELATLAEALAVAERELVDAMRRTASDVDSRRNDGS